jgi:hypothetical protein
VRVPSLLALLLLAGPSPQPRAENTQPLRLHPDNPHYFLWRGKPTIIITSGEHYGAVLNLDFDFRKYLDTLARDGMNGTRTWVGSYVETGGNFNIARNTLDPAPGRYIAPWARSREPGYADGGNKFDLKTWDTAFFARLREFLTHASRRGIIVELNLFCPLYEESMWSVSPMNAANNVNGLGKIARQDVLTLQRSGELLRVQEDLARKIVAEVAGFDNVYIEICNEPYATKVPDDWQRHMATVVGEAVKRLGAPILVSQNVANYALRIENPHPAISIFNFHYATPPDAVAWNHHLNKVIGDNETGFRGTDAAPYRMEAWEFIVAGGGLYNNLDYSFTVGHEDGTFQFPATQPGGGGPTLRRELEVLRDFMDGFDFIRMRPEASTIKGGVPETGSARALAEPGKAYAIYLRRLSSVGSFSARWTGFLVPPATGEYMLHTFSNDGVRLTIDDRKVIENWTDHGDTEDSARVSFQAGQPYRVTLEYFYNGGQGAMKLWWTPPGGSKEPVPSSVLRTRDRGTHGLSAQYYQGNAFERPWFTREDAQVDFAFGTKGPIARHVRSTDAPLAVELPAGAWRAEWIDPLTGQRLDDLSFDHPSGVRELIQPRWQDDVALSIRRR